MSPQAPQLDRGEMAAAERANLQLSQQIMMLMAKALREYARHYPPKVQKTLSDPNAETKVDISMGDEKLLSATLGANNKLKETRTNTITEEQAQELALALSKQQGEMLEGGKIRDIRVLVNGVPLFEMKDGKVLGNNLPPEFQKAIAQMVQVKPLDIAVAMSSPKQSSTTQQEASSGTNSISNATDTNSPKQVTQTQQQATGATNPIPNVAPNQPSSPTGTKPIPNVAPNQSNSPTGTKPIPNVAPNQSSPSIPGQEQINRALIAEAKKSLDRLGSEQSAGNRRWNHEKYTVTQKDGVTSVYVAETKAIIRADGNVITGNARQKDVEALSTVNASIDRELGKPVTKQTEAEL